MGKPPIVTKIETTQFRFDVPDVAVHPVGGQLTYTPGAKVERTSRVLRVFTDQGIVGEYVGGSESEHAAIPQFASWLIGRNALAREAFYNRAKHILKQTARMGLSQVDVALWDIAGKYYDAPVYELLGEYRKDLPCYASTTIGDDSPDGLGSPEAYADFAQQCLEMGYPAFKIHTWREAPFSQHIAMIRAVGERVGGKMDLMIDPACTFKTWGEALKAGKVCDEYGFFWFEDPYLDGGVSAFGHRKLRHYMKTPMLQTENIRGLEQHVDFIVADGTDFVRYDIDYDGGVTGCMKLAHATEGFGLDAEPHGPGPASRHTMAAMRNCNYYEMGLVHPKIPTATPPVYLDGYSDQLDSIDQNGCVQVPEGPGLGVALDWDFIESQKVARAVWT